MYVAELLHCIHVHIILYLGAVKKSADAGGREVGSSKGVRLASGRGREGLPKVSADAPPIILNSLHTDFFLFQITIHQQKPNKNARSENYTWDSLQVLDGRTRGCYSNKYC